MAISSAGFSAPELPDTIPEEWLAPENHPRFFTTPEQLAVAADHVAGTERGRKYVEAQKGRVARFVAMDDEELRDLVPPPGALITYGLGKNLDPLHGEPLQWAGWEDPFRVRDREGRYYPNDEWLDGGDGVEDPETGERFYFRALAHGRIFQDLEQRVLPALADVAALTGCAEHARAAAVLLDAIAEVYPTNRRGPMDYPTSPEHLDRGGRLDRPYYQVARGLYNYARVIDLLAPGGGLERPSAALPDGTIREHIIRNILWDGGVYCYEFAREGYVLDNGHADYLRGASIAGLMLGVREFCEPMIDGPASFFRMLENNLDRNGFYYETAPLYAAHTGQLYFSMAELIERMRRLGWKDIPSAYAHSAYRDFLREPFDRREVGGHVPLIGDNGPDRFQFDPARRIPGGDVSPLIGDQIEAHWIRLARDVDAGNAAKALRRDLGGELLLPDDPWFLYNIGPDLVETAESAEPVAPEDPASVFHGAKGLALLRGGEGSGRYGAQLLFGPIHNHGQRETLTWTFFARGAEWSFDPGHYNTHFRMGWTAQSVAHQALVVDGKSFDWSEGSGYLAAWGDSEDVQFARAVHPGAYRDRGVTRYERTIGQVRNPESGELGYWLDIGLVAGGAVRDDSFHSQHRSVEVETELEPSGEPSFYGDVDFGRIVRGDYRLEGYGQEGFYWIPPGHGYGFLGNPREAKQPDVVRAVYSDPAFADEAKMIVDFSGAPGRKLVLADGPDARGSPEVPYLLRRDEGEEPSVFAKVLRLVDARGDDPIHRFRELPVDSNGAAAGSALPAAWAVEWKNGTIDLWVLSDGTDVVVNDEDSLPAVATDAAVAFLRFDREGSVRRIEAADATSVEVGEARHEPEFGRGQARVRKIDWEDGDSLRLELDWEGGAEVSEVSPGGLAVVHPDFGQPSSWTMKELYGDTLILHDRNAIVGRTNLTSDADGWYRLESNITRFLAALGEPNKGYAIGKALYQNGEYIGRVAELSSDARAIRIEPARENDLPSGESLSVVIAEIAPGDRLLLPGRLSWTTDL